MKYLQDHRAIVTAGRRFALLAAAMLGLSVTTSKAIVVFDNISNVQNGVAGAAITSTGSTPNTFMGDGYVLSTGTNAITGFDVYPVNQTGTTYTSLFGTIYVWGTVNTGTVSAATPAFSNLLGTYTFQVNTNFASGTYLNLESTSPGVTPGVALTNPLSISNTTVGLTFNYQGSTDGVNFASANNLSSLISYGTAPSTGTLVFNGYYRNANSETNGNFTSAVRSLGQTNQGLAVRVYGNAVPEPGTWAMLVLGGLLFVVGLRSRLQAAR